MSGITAKLDALACELEQERPELALAIDLISDRFDKIAGIPVSIRELHKEYREAGGECELDEFLDHVAGFLSHMKLAGKQIAEWGTKNS